MQWGVRQHHAQEGVARGDSAARRMPPLSTQEDDGPARRGEQSCLGRGDVAQFRAAARSATITANGF